ncbi:PilZ domain-containing protein [Erythrobacter aureus]|nr:PilZ domain-containing protein [Erythrobacter aureus]
MIEHTTENRSQARTHLFVAATLTWPNGSYAARLRNVSPDGAMLETKAGPRVGEQVDITRGTLSANGVVVWRMGERVGVRFHNPVVVADWLPSSAAGQQLVDETFRQLKGSSSSTEQRQTAPIEASATSNHQLVAIANRIDDLANALSNDAEVVRRYAGHLPILDVASQKLRKLGL